MARTTDGDVIAVLGSNYDSVFRPALGAALASAGLLVDRVLACAAKRRATVSAAEAELMERYLAADAYAVTDPLYTSKSTDGASGQFLRPTDDAALGPYAMMAVRLDPTGGCLRGILLQRNARADWCGKAPSERINISERS